MTREDYIQLVIDYQDQKPRSGDRLWRANEGLAVDLLHRHRSLLLDAGLDLTDVWHDIVIFMLETAMKYEPDRGVAWSTYATHVISGKIKNLARKYKRLNHDPYHQDWISLDEMYMDTEYTLHDIVADNQSSITNRINAYERLSHQDPKKISKHLNG